MDLKRIRHALTLAQEMNFVRAAEKVHLSQPAFSRSIQALENQLQIQLFDRSKQGLAITAAGAQFLSRARRILQQADDLERDMALTRSGELGRVSFGAGPLPAASLAPDLLREVRQGRPKLHLTLLVNNSIHLLKSLQSEEIEFFIAETRDIPVDGEIAVTPLTRQHGSLFCRSGHPLLTKEKPAIADVLACGFASMNMPRSLLPLFKNALELSAEMTLPVVIESDNVGVLTEVVSNEDLIMLMSPEAVAREITTGRLCALVVEGFPDLFAEIGIVQLRGRSLSPAARLVVNTLQERVR
jgi:DNA-binding transcriptional LysR family regulator